jgi:hypothetical protein
LLWLVPLDWHDPLFLQVDSLSFHLVQILPVTSIRSDARGPFLAKETGESMTHTKLWTSPYAFIALPTLVFAVLYPFKPDCRSQVYLDQV